MKRLLLFAMFIGVVACNKENSSNNTKPDNSNSGNDYGESKITLVADGKTYTVSGRDAKVDLFSLGERTCYVKAKTPISTSDNYIQFSLNGDMKGSSFVGKYFYKHDPSERTHHLPITIVEAGAERYWYVDSLYIDVSSADQKENFSDSIRAKGTFDIWAFKVSGSDSIKGKLTGTFDSW